MGKCASRRFLFDARAITALKAIVSTGSPSSTSVQNLTRVEVATAVIWKCITAAIASNTERTDGEQRSTVITHAVNLRQRALPPFSENCMGNFIFLAAATLCSSNSQETELGSLVIRMREAKKKLDSNIVQGLQGDGGVTKMCELSREMNDTFSRAASDGALEYICFTSWCNFGLYDVDFGWGKPIWMSCVGADKDAPQSVYMNSVILTDSRSCDGVEAWVYLGEQDMAILEHDATLLAFASIDHSPLELGNSASRP